MKELIPFQMKSLRSEEVLGFGHDAINLIMKVRALAETEPVLNFKLAIDRYAAELDLERQVQYKDLEEADAGVDQTLRGFRGHVLALAQNPIESVSEAAKQIQKVIDPYGQPARKALSEQYAIVSRMLSALDALDQNLLTSTFTNGWVDQLHQRYTAFSELKLRYNSERAYQAKGRIPLARNAVFDAWGPVCKVIEGLALLSTEDGFEQLIDQLNVLIQSKKVALKQRRQRKASSGDATNDLSAQSVDLSPDNDGPADADNA